METWENDENESAENESATNDRCLQELLNLGITSFKSKGQKQLVEEVMYGQSSVLGVLPTGGGKSLAIYSGLLGSKLTIAVFPLIAVLNDIKERLVQMKVPSNRYVG